MRSAKKKSGGGRASCVSEAGSRERRGVDAVSVCDINLSSS